MQADNGGEASLSDYRGKKVVLYFYPKDGTTGYTREAVEFRNAVGEFEKESIVIIAVSKDSVHSHQKLKRKHNLPFTLVSDPKRKVSDLNGVWKKKASTSGHMSTEPTTFLVDEKV